MEENIEHRTKCCNYLINLADPMQSPVFYNRYNQVVQCHNCGTTWEPVS